MPLIHTAEGAVFVCTRGASRDRECAHCGLAVPGYAVRLCDFQLAPLRFGEAPKTCDKPLHSTCAIHVGRDTDHCPEHPR